MMQSMMRLIVVGSLMVSTAPAAEPPPLFDLYDGIRGADGREPLDAELRDLFDRILTDGRDSEEMSNDSRPDAAGPDDEAIPEPGRQRDGDVGDPVRDLLDAMFSSEPRSRFAPANGAGASESGAEADGIGVRDRSLPTPADM